MRAKPANFIGKGLWFSTTVLIIISLLAKQGGTYSDSALSYTDRKYGLQKTLFVVDIIANGASTQDSKDVFGEGVPKGKLTEKGRSEARRLGIRRRNEYVDEKKLMPIKFNASSILALSPLSK